MLSNIGAKLRHWRRCFSRAEWETDYLRLPRHTKGSHLPGLLLIQIDGLARVQLERAIAAGQMPFLRRLLGREGCRLHTFYSGLPASTPAVQAELYYGVRTAVPAFSYLDPRAGGIGMMMYPEWAKRVEANLAGQAEGLLKGGSSWSNIYTGGAAQEESHFCGASIGLGDMWRTGKIRNLFLFGLLHFPSFVRLVALLVIESVISLYDAVRGAWRGHSLGRELRFILARVFACIGLRELITLGAKIDLARGLPIIHVNFLGYDEQSHRRGPGSRFAHWTLRGIDRAIRQLHRSAHLSEGRDYTVWIFSDHGQVKTREFDQDVPGGLAGAVERFAAPESENAPPARRRAPERPLHAPMPRWRKPEREEGSGTADDPFSPAGFAVACLGPVGHVYTREPLTPERDEALVRHLLAEGVPGVLRRHNDAVVWSTREGDHVLPEDLSQLRGPEELRPAVARDLADLVQHPYAGNLVCLGWQPWGPLYSFARENGAHAGPSPDEIQGFLLLPPDSAPFLSAPIVRPSRLRTAALMHLGRLPRPARRSRRPDDRRTRLRVVTYNAHYCKGLDGRFAPERIARVLRELDPDIVALQEIDCGRPRSRREDQLAFLAGELGLQHLFCASIDHAGERYGHGLLAREALCGGTCTRLPDGGGRVIEPRDAIRATTRLGGREVTLIGTHLGLAVSERRAQIDRLLQPDLLGGIAPDQPAIFLGDLNLSPGGSLYRQLVAPWQQTDGAAVFRDVQAHAPGHVAAKTFPSFFPVRQLDHVFVTSQFEVRAVHTPVNLLTRRASDHLPLVADLEYVA